jgi:hypothetical protein
LLSTSAISEFWRPRGGLLSPTRLDRGQERRDQGRGQVLGRQIEDVDLTADEYEGYLVVTGWPEWVPVEFASIYGRGFYRAGGSSFVTTAEDLLGRPPRAAPATGPCRSSGRPSATCAETALPSGRHPHGRRPVRVPADPNPGLTRR